MINIWTAGLFMSTPGSLPPYDDNMAWTCSITGSVTAAAFILAIMDAATVYSNSAKIVRYDTHLYVGVVYWFVLPRVADGVDSFQYAVSFGVFSFTT